MRECRLMFAMLVSAAGLGAWAQSPTVYVEQPDHWGRLARIVRPAYPPEALRARLTGSVEVEGVVEGSGRLGDARYKPSTPAAEAFVAALREVVPFWQFTPVPGNDCQPGNTPVSARVEFEIDNGQPRIFVTQLPRAAVAAALKPVSAPAPRYPHLLRERRIEGRAYARAEIDASGNVVAVSATAYPRRPPVAVTLAAAGGLAPATLPRQREEELGDFAYEAGQALKRWSFPPASAARRVFCAEFFYDLAD